MKRKIIGKRILAGLMAAIMAFSVLPIAGIGGKAQAATTTVKKVACLATGAIKSPKAPEDGSSPWTGSYVWYGKYDGDPVKYRVLDPKTTIFGGTTMFLDCDRILYRTVFDEDREANEGATYANEWKYSDARIGLNGNAFLTKANGFTNQERAAITNSKADTHVYDDVKISGRVWSWFFRYVALSGEKVFFLDAEDVENPNYGYSTDDGNEESESPMLLVYHEVKCREKLYRWNNESECSSEWWLRSGCSAMHENAGGVYGEGVINHPRVEIALGVSPAFNVKLSSILFSSVVSGTAGKDNAEYKLTLIDSGIAASVTSGKKLSASGNKITVPYSVSGSNASKATQMSILILDKEYTDGNTNNAKIKYYGKLNTTGSFATTGTGTFDLPTSLSMNNWGLNYYVYLLAEDVNGKQETDYASKPIALTAPGASTISKQPYNLTAVVGETAKISVTATGSGTLTYQWQSKAPGASSWTNSQQSGATTATLSVATNINHNGYQFRCIVRNNGIPIVTNVVTLTAKGKIGLATSQIKAPATGEANKAWTGSYVWYGKYDGQSVKYRVLTPRTSKYGATTMLLDCDKILYQAAFDDALFDDEGICCDPVSNEWACSDAKNGLNSDSFLSKSNGFTTIEKSAMANSKIASHELTYGEAPGNVSGSTSEIYYNYVALTGEKVFLLDSEDVSNCAYGYYFDDSPVTSRKKNYNGEAAWWWLRSAYHFAEYSHLAGYVRNAGDIVTYGSVTGASDRIGISPAFNVKVNSVIFSSVVSGTAGKDNAEYKLTLADSNMSIALQSGKSMTISGRKITVPYTITGSDASKANHVSVLILNKEYKAGNSNNASILYYGTLNRTAAFATTGTGTFEIPTSLKLSGWGTEYFVYLLAEDVNGIHESDYASTPLKLDAANVSNSPVQITTQPKSKTVAVGSKAEFSVVADSIGAPTYQWQAKAPGSNTWKNSTQTGATTAKLSVTTNVNHEGYQYRCIVKNSGGKQATSNAATLTVKPGISTQPLSQRVIVGATATFSVVATGVAPLTYQWQAKAPGSNTWKNSTQTGATTAKLSVATNINHEGYQYRCIVTDGNGRQTISNAATLKIAPKITTQPKNAKVTVGTTVTFSVAATGKATLTYQWQAKAPGSNTWKNSTQTGATTSKLSVKTNVNHNGYQYRCAVTDGNGRTTYSSAATITVP